MRVRIIGSGSSGNVLYIESGDTRVLVDVGLSARETARRLTEAGIDPSSIDGIIVTHEHGDHARGVSVFARSHDVPVYTTAATREACQFGRFESKMRFAEVRSSESFQIGAIDFHPFTVPHDAREPLQLRCSDGASSLGILTDLGHATEHVLAQLAACQALLLECNHDADLLAGGAYPAFLKKRVGGKMGHLSNARAGEIARALRHPGLATVVARPPPSRPAPSSPRGPRAVPGACRRGPGRLPSGRTLRRRRGCSRGRRRRDPPRTRRGRGP